MPDFVVKHVRSDQTELWHERWPLNGEPSKRALAADRHGELGQSEHVTAKDEQEARKIIRGQFPGHTIMGVDRVRTR